ncbi:MAG: hypothetical protein J6X25_06145 [Bacteroidales bacterium]|nr:hypothetical protein [Bacteroidales bacterium]
MVIMEDSLMKKISLILMTAFAVAAVSCNKEVPSSNDVNAPEAVKAPTLVARISADDTKTAFVSGVYMWKTNDNFVVRSDNANGYTTYQYSGEPTAGAAEFVPKTDDAIVYGQNSFAIYPARVSGSYPCEEGGSLKVVLKDTYTWAEGNVEAPMLARVETGQPLEFKHLGGVLKVTYKNVPPKATKLVVSAPVVDPDLIAVGKNTYKICSTMNQTYNWTTAGGGFDPVEVPYVKAYDHSGTYKIAINIASATAAQRTSDDGITAYIPLPVGPVVSGGQNVYPQLKVWLAFEDDTEVPGSLRTASNVQIERAHIKPMPAIVMPKYTVETIITGLGRTPHNLTRLSDDQFVVTAEQYHVYFLDVVKNTATQSAVNASSKYPPYPYGVCCIGNNLWIANKTGATGNCIYKYDMTTQLYSIATTGINQAMQIQEHDGNVYVLGRGDASNAGKIHVFTGNVPGAVDAEVFADFSGIASSGYAWPLSFAFDTDGSMVVAVSASAGTPSECFKLYRVASKGATPVAIFGSGTKASNYAGLVDGSSSSATFSANMLQMQFDGEGNLYIGDTFAVRKLVRGATGLEDGTIMTLTESGYVTNTDGLAMDSTCSHIYLSNKSTKSISKVTIE